MLTTTPVDAPSEALHLWSVMKPATTELFQKYWDKLDLDYPMLDWDNVVYAEWTDDDGNKYTGMQHLRSKEPHGIVRVIQPDGLFMEATFVNGK